MTTTGRFLSEPVFLPPERYLSYVERVLPLGTFPDAVLAKFFLLLYFVISVSFLNCELIILTVVLRINILTIRCVFPRRSYSFFTVFVFAVI